MTEQVTLARPELLAPLTGPWRYKMPEGSQPAYEIALAHFIVSDDVVGQTTLPGGWRQFLNP